MRLLKILSIRSLLVFLILLSSLPLLMLVVWTNKNAERQALQLLSENAAETARNFTASQHLVDAFLVSTLDLFASDSALQNLCSADAVALFRREADRMKMLEDVLLVAPDGTVVASLGDRSRMDLSAILSTGDEVFSNVPRAGNVFFVGEAAKKSRALLPCVRFFEPARAPASRYAIVLLLKTDYFENLAERLLPPGGWTLRVVDVSGRPLLCYPRDRMGGKIERGFSSVWEHIRSGGDSGTYMASDAGYVFGYSCVRFTPDSSAYAVTIVSFPTEHAVSNENAYAWRTLLLTGAFTILGLLLSLGVGRLLLLVPIDKLVQAHRRFTLGDLTSRADIRNGVQEMMLLSKAFDEMASVLEVQDLKRRSETEEIKEQAHKDYLTGTWNRRAGLLALERLMSEAREHRMVLAVFFIDIDFFKQINDEFGHNEGDKMLRRVTFLLERHLRARDILCRYGGDEFLVILPGCTWEAAEDVWRRIEKEIRRIDGSGGVPYVFSLSHGLAIFDPVAPAPPTLEQLIAEADAKMYEEKSRHKAEH